LGAQRFALKNITDLKGKKFGVWSRGAGATKALQVLVSEFFAVVEQDRR
jgi:ABC-type nitrate/sulfonate/bicarbonate transport system substrate-binding protein